MSSFNPDKLSVEFRDGVTTNTPVIPRLHTLTHSDITGDLFLTIGKEYAWNLINSTRDEVLGEWVYDGRCFYYYVYIYIDQGEYSQTESAKRNEIFRRELSLALTAIRYGDRPFFNAYPRLIEAPIIIHFISVYPQFARQENWATFQRFAI